MPERTACAPTMRRRHLRMERARISYAPWAIRTTACPVSLQVPWRRRAAQVVHSVAGYSRGASIAPDAAAPHGQRLRLTPIAAAAWPTATFDSNRGSRMANGYVWLQQQPAGA